VEDHRKAQTASDKAFNDKKAAALVSVNTKMEGMLPKILSGDDSLNEKTKMTNREAFLKYAKTDPASAMKVVDDKILALQQKEEKKKLSKEEKQELGAAKGLREELKMGAEGNQYLGILKLVNESTNEMTIALSQKAKV
jgi:hypothetical protein